MQQFLKECQVADLRGRLLRIQSDLLLLIHDPEAAISAEDREKLRLAQTAVAEVKA